MLNLMCEVHVFLNARNVRDYDRTRGALIQDFFFTPPIQFLGFDFLPIVYHKLH